MFHFDLSDDQLGLFTWIESSLYFVVYSLTTILLFTL